MRAQTMSITDINVNKTYIQASKMVHITKVTDPTD